MTERAKRKGDLIAGESKTVAQAAKLILPEIRSLRQALSVESSPPAICQTLSGELEVGERLVIDFARHFHLPWSHFPILLTPSRECVAESRILLNLFEFQHHKMYIDHSLGWPITKV